MYISILLHIWGPSSIILFYIIAPSSESEQAEGTFQGLSIPLSALDSNSGSGNCCKPRTGYCYKFGCGSSSSLVPPGIIVLFSSRPYMCCMSLYLSARGGHCHPECGHMKRSV